jgi:hypothetical protein
LCTNINQYAKPDKLFLLLSTIESGLKRNMYIIKIKGIGKIPDYLQIRDESFTLLVYCRVDRPEKALNKGGFGPHLNKIKQIADKMPFGKLQKLELNE